MMNKFIRVFHRAHAHTLRICPRSGSANHAVPLIGRYYTTSNAPPKKPPLVNPPPTRRTPSPTHPQTRHEAQEGTAAISMPFNPPGGGPNIPGGGGGAFSFTNSPVLDAMLTTAIGLGAVFLGGVAYVKWYKKNVLDKIENAFAPGYDPALELAKTHTSQKAPVDDKSSDPLFTEQEPWTSYLRRKEQEMIDHIIHGEESGHYFMLLGPKGSGKGTMIFDSMAACDAEGVSMCDAHPDLEVFRLRLGKALNFEYNEDTQTGLFQRRDPREGGAALDIERALTKLEKVALRCAPRRGKPLVLIINNVHFLQNNEEGQNMLLQLQQKAEAWAASGILTMLFTSDDFWPFHVMRKTGSRMHVISVYDLDNEESLHAASRMRRSVGRPPAETDDLKEAVSYVGGRLSYLNKVSKSKDMLGMAKHLLDVEKAWLLSQIGLIPDCDDDVMDEQKWSSCSWLLLREFVKLRKEQRAAIAESGIGSETDLPLPAIPYWRCRQIMTRPDFMEELDRLNIIAIDIQHNVRPDSNLILHAAQEVCNEEGFDDLLDNVRDRIDEIESLHRTRELTFKDLGKGDMVRLAVDKRGEELLKTLDDS
ncbi:hypothetical protein GALMADRAFT_495888 [Galerina marginata CBS 339.88]|uniref:AAA protein C-terminal winged helix domain-containing protein n=1 Tax=Galerina marginata (strain CBS 339.88) TaxID=685588 RepID=A0A067SXR8_GALM3|nr:hypothetical protein GALMADRAFT_495888 [Galerina marginata CBS 339.88]